MKKLVFNLMILYLVLYSCTDQVENPDFVPNPIEVAINGAISPQSEVIEIRVANVVDATSSDLNISPITTADVVLSDEDGNSIQLIFNEFTGKYQTLALDFPLYAGERYFLVVRIDQKEYTASCKIPQQRIDQISHDFQLVPDEEGNIKSALVIEFEDIIQETNFYIIGADVISEFSIRALDFGLERFANDVLEDGRVIKGNGLGRFSDSDMSYLIKVANVEEILYQSLFASYSNRTNENNPFYDVIIPPNNIEGENVYGVFAGYQLTEKEVVGN